MSQSAKPIHVGRDVSLYTPTGESVECLTIWLWNTTPLSARLLVPTDEWRRLHADGVFGIDALSLSLPLRSVDSLLVALEAVDPSPPSDASTLKKQFADPESALRSTETWAATGIRHHESATDAEVDGDSPAEETPRVNDIGISMHQSRHDSSPEQSSAAGHAASAVDTDELTAALSRVAAGLTAENRPFEASEDGTSLSLTATVDHATWTVVIEDLTVGDDDPASEVDEPCLIRSLFPDRLGAARRTSLHPELDAYTATLNRGGFVVDAAGHVEFETPFDPHTESTTDALTENVTALAEWFDRLAD